MFDIPEFPEAYVKIDHQSALTIMRDRARKLGLLEHDNDSSLEDIGWPKCQQELFEYLVGEYLYELGYAPCRLPQTETNLDFKFEVEGETYWAECVCPQMGNSDKDQPSKVHDPRPYTSEEYESREIPELGLKYQFASRENNDGEANRVGLRVTSSIRTKYGDQANPGQILKYHEGKVSKKTIIFLCTGLFESPDDDHITCNLRLSSTAGALLGMRRKDVVLRKQGQHIEFHQRLEHQNLLDKSGIDVPSTAFLDGTYPLLSAVVHFQQPPIGHCKRIINRDLSLTELFSKNAELIRNLGAIDSMQLTNPQDIFPGMLDVPRSDG